MTNGGSVSMRIDSKGKYFTKVVSTQTLEVLLRLSTGELIQGQVHVRPDRRLSDEMNDDLAFLSVTEARVLGEDGEEKYRTSYMSVSRKGIVWAIPAQAVNQHSDHNYTDDDDSSM